MLPNNTIVKATRCLREAKIWANILNKIVLHKAGSKTTLSNLHKFVLFHLMENLLRNSKMYQEEGNQSQPQDWWQGVDSLLH